MGIYNEPLYLTVGEAGRRLGCSASAIRRRVQNGSLSAIRTARGMRLLPAAVVERALRAQAKMARKRGQS